MEVNQYAKEIKKKNPDFVIVLGNEVYLVDKRENGIKYYIKEKEIDDETISNFLK